jgi:hypothetical protein
VASNYFPDATRLMICSACGYPTIGVALCAVCVLAPADAQVAPVINVFNVASDVNPAA